MTHLSRGSLLSPPPRAVARPHARRVRLRQEKTRHDRDRDYRHSECSHIELLPHRCIADLLRGERGRPAIDAPHEERVIEESFDFTIAGNVTAAGEWAGGCDP